MAYMVLCIAMAHGVVHISVRHLYVYGYMYSYIYGYMYSHTVYVYMRHTHTCCTSPSSYYRSLVNYRTHCPSSLLVALLPISTLFVITIDDATPSRLLFG